MALKVASFTTSRHQTNMVKKHHQTKPMGRIHQVTSCM